MAKKYPESSQVFPWNVWLCCMTISIIIHNPWNTLTSMWSVTFSCLEKKWETSFISISPIPTWILYILVKFGHDTSGLNSFSGALEAKRGRQPPSLQSSCSLISYPKLTLQIIAPGSLHFPFKTRMLVHTNIINYTHIIANIYIYIITHITSWTISCPSSSLKFEAFWMTYFQGFNIPNSNSPLLWPILWASAVA